MNFFMKCVILMLVFTFGPIIFYAIIGLVIALIGSLSGGNDK